MSVALELFGKLCEVGNLLECWRDRYVPGSDNWCAVCDLLQRLDAAIDTLVRSNGLHDGEDNEDA